jgi:F-type H+-transporting ATPase subunit epsilon
MLFELTIITPEGVFLQDQVVSLNVPGGYGYLQVLANHAPLICALHAGKITIVDKDKQTQLYAIAGGFLEVFHNKVTILADAIESAKGIDFTRAKLALLRAKRRVDRQGSDIDLFRARSAYDRAANRMRLSPNKRERKLSKWDLQL